MCTIYQVGTLLMGGALMALCSVASTDAAVDDETEAGASEGPAEESIEAEVSEAVVFERLLVSGGPDRVREVPGAFRYLTSAELEEQEHTDLQRILQQVPGVNLQDEDGYGLRPNIGMRGTGTERSAKITLLEDGVLAAPAPYAAPAAYYVPTAGRMSAVEVMKGASSIRQGPYTTGGVLNLVSTEIPPDLGGSLELMVGEDATTKLHAVGGDSGDRWSWMVETFQLESEGFKDLDGGGETGFDLGDYLGKVRWTTRPDSRHYQILELKLGRTDQHGRETYLGVTDDDFALTPYRRYAGSQEDLIDVEHDLLQVRHFAQLSDRLDLTTTVYRHDTFRNWRKLQSVLGASISSVLDDPERFAGELAILRGEVDSEPGSLRLRNNRRTYFSQGLQSVVGTRFRQGAITQQLEVGVRIHEDEEDRFQEEDLWRMENGQMLFDDFGSPGSQSNRVSSANAFALFLDDRIELGRWVLRPGIRYESIDYRREEFGTTDPERDGEDLVVNTSSITVWVPGLGVDYLFDHRMVLFAGVHRGFAPPGPGRSDDTEAEKSLNWELGFRTAVEAFGSEVVAFFNDYDNLLGADTLSSGGEGTGDLFNGGAATAYGLEVSAWWNVAAARRALTVPLKLAYTYTHAEFRTSFDSSYQPWGSVESGDELPYLPPHQIAAGVGVRAARWEVFVEASWVDRMRTEAGQGPVLTATSTDDRLVLDLAGNLQVASGLRLQLQLRNLTDEVYVAARRPAGARPGLPRTALVGLNWKF